MVAWNLSAAFFVNVESSDGYASIINSQYFLGLSEGYRAQRNPMLSWLLMPAEWLATQLELHPFDVWLHHLFQALINALYLLGVYVVLRRYATDERVVLVVFLATIPTYIFFSYAPYLNTDFFPGLIFLLMLLIAHRYVQRPSWQAWVALVVLGACAALTKATFALFWVILLLVWGCVLLWRGEVRRFTVFVAGAGVSGLITWVLLAFSLIGAGTPGRFVLLYPYDMIRAVALYNQAAVESGVWSWWYYFENALPAYGGSFLILSIVGVLFAFYSRKTLNRALAAAWLMAFGIMVIIPYKEMRYLAFLAPLSAFLALDVVDRVASHHRRWLWMALMGAVLLLDLGRSVMEAVRVYDPYFREDQVVRFLRVVDDKAKPDSLILMSQAMSFQSSSHTALPGDRYHRITHFEGHMVEDLYAPSRHIGVSLLMSPATEKLKKYYASSGVVPGWGRGGRIHSVKDLEHPEMFPEKTVVLMASKLVVRFLGAEELQTENDDHVQFSAFTQRIVYKRDGDRYVVDGEVDDKRPFIVIRPDTDEGESNFDILGSQLLEGDAAFPSHDAGDKIEIWGYRVDAFCKLQCVFYDE